MIDLVWVRPLSLRRGGLMKVLLVTRRPTGGLQVRIRTMDVVPSTRAERRELRRNQRPAA